MQSWDAYFRQVESGKPPGQAYQPPPILGQSPGMVATPQTVPSAVDQSTINELVSDHLAVYSLIRCYQVIQRLQWIFFFLFFFPLTEDAPGNFGCQSYQNIKLSQYFSHHPCSLPFNSHDLISNSLYFSHTVLVMLVWIIWYWINL